MKKLIIAYILGFITCALISIAMIRIEEKQQKAEAIRDTYDALKLEEDHYVAAKSDSAGIARMSDDELIDYTARRARLYRERYMPVHGGPAGNAP